MASPLDPDDTRSPFQRMRAGDPYRSGDPEIVAALRWGAARRDAFNATAADADDARPRILAGWLGAIGPASVIRPPLWCEYGTQTRVGDHTFVNFGLVALDVATITIGDHVQIGPNVQLLTPTHPLDPATRRAGWEAAEPIVIGDNVWLGGGAIVLPGVTVGDDTVVGAGAVVTRDLPAGVLAVGNPARVIRRL